MRACVRACVGACVRVCVLGGGGGVRFGAPRGAAMLIRSSTMKSRKSLARDVFATFATLVRLVDDIVIQTAGRKVAALTAMQSAATFERRFLTGPNIE